MTVGVGCIRFVRKPQVDRILKIGVGDRFISHEFRPVVGPVRVDGKGFLDLTLVGWGQSSGSGEQVGHGIHARNVPIPKVLIEIGGILEHIRQGVGRVRVPIAKVLVEGPRAPEHALEVPNGADVPVSDVLVEVARLLKHRIHVGDRQTFQLPIC